MTALCKFSLPGKLVHHTYTAVFQAEQYINA